MLSICIPVYNHNIQELVKELLHQLQSASIKGEIVVIDDASLAKFKVENRTISAFEQVVYIELEKNVGRSAIRNLFLKHTKFENLLFLDCDVKIHPDNFISNYLKSNAKVTCGGLLYPAKRPTRKHLLRWKYGVYRECRLAKERAQEPYKSFMTSNFMIKKNVLEKIRFDERLTDYGHEDTLFGYALMKKSIQIKHIDNQVIHNSGETSAEFLKKTRKGIENLWYIHTELLPTNKFSEINTLLKTYKKVKARRLVNLLSFLSYPILPVLSFLIRAGIVFLWCFDVYKLLYLCRVSKIKTNHST
jgi:glycosyltransferase involved in cell wall biosynthesis